MRKGNGLASFFPILRVSHWPQLISFFFWKLLSPTDGCVASKCIDMRKQKPPFYTWTKNLPVNHLNSYKTNWAEYLVHNCLAWLKEQRYSKHLSWEYLAQGKDTTYAITSFSYQCIPFFRSRFNPHKRTSFSDDRDGTRFSSTHRSKVKDFHLHDEINCKHTC